MTLNNHARSRFEERQRYDQNSYRQTDNTTREPARAATRISTENHDQPSSSPFPPRLNSKNLTITCTTSRTHCTGGQASSARSRNQQPTERGRTATPGRSQQESELTNARRSQRIEQPFKNERTPTPCPVDNLPNNTNDRTNQETRNSHTTTSSEFHCTNTTNTTPIHLCRSTKRSEGIHKQWTRDPSQGMEARRGMK